MTNAQTMRNRPYDQPAERSFPITIPGLEPSEPDLPATVTLSNMTGLPLPWNMLQNAVIFMLHETSPWHLHETRSHEDITLVDPDTGAETEEVLALTFRPTPNGHTISKKGIRTHRGTMETRTAIDGPLGYHIDPLEMPLTRVWTEIAVNTGTSPALVDVLESPGARRHRAEAFAQRMGDTYAVTRPKEKDSRTLELGIADLQWDLDNGMLGGDQNISEQIALLNLRNLAGWTLQDRRKAAETTS